MKVYCWNYESLFLFANHEEDSRYCMRLKGTPVKEWHEIVIKDNEFRRGKLIDISGFIGGSPIFSSKAKETFHTLLKNKVEFLPLNHENGETYHLVNVINVLDCIDYETAVVNKEEIMPRVVRAEVIKYQFQYELIKDELMFKIPENSTTRVFVTDEFLRVVEENGLIGIQFEEVWNSDKSEELNKEQQYDKYLALIKQQSGEEVTFEEALERMKEGKAFIHEGSKIQLGKDGQLVIGSLQFTGEYVWITPSFIPPNFLQLRWYEIEVSMMTKRVS